MEISIGDSNASLKTSPIERSQDVVSVQDVDKTDHSEHSGEALDSPELSNPGNETPNPVESKVEEDTNDDDTNNKVDSNYHGNHENTGIIPETVEPPAKAVDDAPVSFPTKEPNLVFDPDLADRTGWDNLRWMSYSGIRKVDAFFTHVYRYQPNSGGNTPTSPVALFWNKAPSDEYQQRALALYHEPPLVLVLKTSGLQDSQHPQTLPHEEETTWKVESVVDPTMAKLTLSPLTTSTSLPPHNADARRNSCIVLQSPLETIALSAVHHESYQDSVALHQTTQVEQALVQALLRDRVTVQHQIILGTLHAHVLSGNITNLKQAIARGRNDIDRLDAQQRPAIYYACQARNHQAVACLVAAGAKADYTCTNTGRTLAHVCALALDDASLSTLLAANIEPSSNDTMGMTPLLCAVLYGRNTSGKRDKDRLERCWTVLDAWQGADLLSPLYTSHNPDHPAVTLAKTWHYEHLEILLDHVSHQFPLKDSWAEVTNLSLSALYGFPLHQALITLVMICREGPDSFHADGDLLLTLKTLLDHGMEPNERLEVGNEVPCDPAGLDEWIGFAPLQIIAMAYIEFQQHARDLDEALVKELRETIQAIALFLVSNGARLHMEIPPYERPRKLMSSSSLHSDKSQSLSSPLRAFLKLDERDDLLSGLGGKERLIQAYHAWQSRSPVDIISEMSLVQVDDKSRIPDADNSPGGSSERSCAICWAQFGTLTNRKHRCRISLRHVCDECSTRRVLERGQEYRVTDGQYLHAVAETLHTESRIHVKSRKQDKIPVVTKSLAQVRLDRLEAQEEANRVSLFGGLMETVFGSDQDDKQTIDESQQSLQASLSETRNALLDRGEKLSSLQEKTSQMVDSSASFAKMATELRKQTERGFFW